MTFPLLTNYYNANFQLEVW